MASTPNEVVSHEAWIEARKKLLAKEKQLTRELDEVAQLRRTLPRELVSKSYVFDTPKGKTTLDALFDGRSQLLVYHAMFDPKTAGPRTTYTKDAACQGCSSWMDQFDGMLAHLNARDVTLIAASRAPIEKIEAYKKRMGWNFEWVSVGEGDFNRDLGVTLTADEIANGNGVYNYEVGKYPPMPELPGLSVFLKESTGRIFHTYSAYARGLDIVNAGHQLLDLIPRGRQEARQGGVSPKGGWVRRHDEYENAPAR